MIGRRLMFFAKPLQRSNLCASHRQRRWLTHGELDVIAQEDTGGRLRESQFGYQSVHLTVKLPASWLSVPSFSGLGSLMAEIQIRTLAQHIWAVASHKLQYKQEASVPEPVRRSIHRVSALLETVDLEFERVVDERARYLEEVGSGAADESLNVDLLTRILSESLPEQNRVESEHSAKLLDDLDLAP